MLNLHSIRPLRARVDLWINLISLTKCKIALSLRFRSSKLSLEYDITFEILSFSLGCHSLTLYRLFLSLRWLLILIWVLRMFKSQCAVHLWEHFLLWHHSWSFLIILNDVIRARIANSRSRDRSLRRRVDVDVLYLLGLHLESSPNHSAQSRLVSLLVLENLYSRAKLPLHLRWLQITMSDTLGIPTRPFPTTSFRLLYM